MYTVDTNIYVYMQKRLISSTSLYQHVQFFYSSWAEEGAVVFITKQKMSSMQYSNLSNNIIKRCEQLQYINTIVKIPVVQVIYTTGSVY